MFVFVDTHGGSCTHRLIALQATVWLLHQYNLQGSAENHHHHHFFRSHRSSTLDFGFLSHYSYIKAIMLYKGKAWQDSGILWNTLAYSGILWHTLAYSGILWHTLTYSGILWHTLAYSGIHWHTLAYSGLLWHTLAYSGILWHTLAYSGIL